MAAISRSRVTLAMIDAAAMETIKPSPPTIVSAGAGKPRRRHVAIDQHVIGRLRQAGDGAAHRP